MDWKDEILLLVSMLNHVRITKESIIKIDTHTNNRGYIISSGDVVWEVTEMDQKSKLEIRPIFMGETLKDESTETEREAEKVVQAIFGLHALHRINQHRQLLRVHKLRKAQRSRLSSVNHHRQIVF